jgi:hypothetical protein
MPQRSAYSTSFFLLVALCGSLAGAQAYRVEPLKESPPKVVSEPVRTAVSPEALRVSGPKDAPFLDVWPAKDLETVEAVPRLGVDFGLLREGALLAVLRFHVEGKTFRGRSFQKGTYTIRKLTMPEDGDHVGVSETRDFVLLCPAQDDAKPEPVPAEALIPLSGKVSRSKHPATLYLVKMFDEPEGLPRAVHDADRDYWILDLSVRNRAKGGKPVRFGLVVVGEADELY